MKSSTRIKGYLTTIAVIGICCQVIRADAPPTDYQPQNYSLVPPSPEVGALIEYSEFGVDYHSGLPQISIPLFSIKSGDLEIPVTLASVGLYRGAAAKTDTINNLNRMLPGASLQAGVII